MRTKYRFIGRHDGRYFWEAAVRADLGIDVRRELISCPVDWFWGR